MIRWRALCGLVLLAATCVAPAPAMTIERGYFYATSDYQGAKLLKYDGRGRVVESMDLDRPYPRGLVFDRTGRLLILFAENWDENVLNVYAPDGSVVRSVTVPGWIRGNLAFGKLVFTGDGALLVGTAYGVYRLDPALDAVDLLTTAEAYGLAALPNGELLVAGNYLLRRFTAEGSLLSEQSALGNAGTPGGLAGIIDARGLFYDARTERTWLAMLGTSGYQYPVIHVDRASGDIVHRAHHEYGSDMGGTTGGRVIVGSRSLPPTLYAATGEVLLAAEGPPARFVADHGLDEILADGFE